MLTPAKISLYDLTKCGYYPFHGNASPILFGGIAQTFTALSAWAGGKTLGETSTIATGDGDGRGSVFYLDMHKGPNGDFLVGLWNRVPSTGNNVSSVGVSDYVGSASSSVTKIDPNRIHGFATYFWVMPAEQRIACVRLKSEVNGLDSFQRYMLSFLKNVNPQNVVPKPLTVADEVDIAGYRADTTSNDVVPGAFPKFLVKSIPLAGDIQFLRSNVASINRVFCNTTLSSETATDYTKWQVMLDVTKMFKSPPPLRQESLVKIEFPMTFTSNEFEEVVTSWNERENNTDATGQDVLGFKLSSGELKWLHKSRAKAGYQMDVVWDDADLVNIESLFTQLQVHRSAVVALG